MRKSILRKIIIHAVVIILCIISVTQIGWAQNDTGVNLVLDPATFTGKRGDTFNLIIKAVPHNQKFFALDIFLNFDPDFLQVIDSVPAQEGIQIKPGTVLTSQLLNRANNSSGEISFSAALPFGQEYNSDSPVVVGSISFKINSSATGQTAVIFGDKIPRRTQVAYAGESVWSTLVGTGVAVNAVSAPVQPIIRPEPPPPPPPAPPVALITQLTPIFNTEINASPSPASSPAPESGAGATVSPSFTPPGLSAGPPLSSLPKAAEPSVTFKPVTNIPVTGEEDASSSPATPASKPLFSWWLIAIIVGAILDIALLIFLLKSHFSRT